MKKTLDFEKYTKTARAAVASGQVLLKNDNDVLPIAKGSTVSLFGRAQMNYYKSGTGSGGLVNVNRVIGVLEALRELPEEDDIKIYEPVTKKYEEFVKDHPFDEGVGWANEPLSQVEMPIDDEFAKNAAANSDYAIVIIGRSAGEDHDNRNEKGAYLLNDVEMDMLKKVRNAFDKMIVLLNVGNVVDMTFVDEVNPDSVMYIWQGGMIGGLGTVDVLLGKVSPSGKLSDTIVYNIDDYPSTKNFGGEVEAIYEEDIFVGYRYFETFAKEKVRYPFGFGLSYTSFDINTDSVVLAPSYVSTSITVTNVGMVPGREVVQIYIEAPLGKLSKPSKVLAGFAKTKELNPGAAETVNIDIPFRNFASFDDDGRCGLGTGFVLEEGKYNVYVGGDVRSASLANSFSFEETKMIAQLENALGPVQPFKRMITVNTDTGVTVGYEDAPLRKDTMTKRRAERLPQSTPITGDKGYKLLDVKNNKVSMKEFIAQFTEEELCTIIRGEGMSSRLVTPGTASAFGGIIPSLKAKGIPIGCMDDGPSGMRLDSGMKAFALPNGTLLACSFDMKINEELFAFTGIEMIKNKVDVLLGPGMNIHRHPLNGRNFEYFSEDPLLSGMIGAYQVKGLQSAGVTGTIKHFACNNQETARHEVNPVLSERALREIYLRGFEIAVDNGADSVMTTYSLINGVYTAGNYDLNTTVLREQWGFKGIVMTDWWARISEENVPYDKVNFAGMVRAQNDLYMCVPGATDDIGDNALSSLKDGSLSVGELQRTAANVCGFLMKYAVFTREYEEPIDVEIINAEEGFDEKPIEVDFIPVNGETVIDLSDIEVTKGGEHYFGIELNDLGTYEVTIVARGLGNNELAQLPVVLFMHTMPIISAVFRGTGEIDSCTESIKFLNKPNVMHFYFGQGGVELKELRFKLIDTTI
ncbi:MAG: glycoside hydrolase family 3 C-terminal domain-containing protein [Lachnospiraceae bacterium]|nr:glycoside hydrolase family 3 C-terminal domain-containing protein [Lachnospiraceae bacterium]